jgi:beta-ureidopropionase / N-carbamoyl-L-amino-acid hydrolase
MEARWLQEKIDQIATFSETKPGITRLAFSSWDEKVQDFFVREMEQVGLTVRKDAVGNLIGRLEGTDRAATVVATGSHLDSVPQGGRYDGVVGVVGGLLAIKRLSAKGPLTHPVELIIFAAEESSRFSYSTIGSKVMTGAMQLRAWKRAVDREGISLIQALKNRVLDFDQLSHAVRSKDDFKCFIELHIEQGYFLERAKDVLGVVEAIAAPTRLKITVAGEAAHSGTTPMDGRHDALVSAAKIVLAVRDIAMEQSHLGTVGSVGVLNVQPGAINVIPGNVEMWVDIRGVQQESIIDCIQELKDFVSTLAEEEETPAAIDVLASDRPVILDEVLAGQIETICKRQKISYRRMNSGAGHDAMNMAKITPTGMIFIPCKNGVSHNPAESAKIEDILTGVDVLTQILFEQAK